MSTQGVGGSSFFGGTLGFSSQDLIFNPLSPTVSFQGLGTGLDTTSIVNALLALNEVPVQALSLQQEGLQAQQNELQTLQTQLQGVINDATDLGSPTLFSTSQTATSSDSSLVTATVADSGAPIGAYQVTVSQLASSAQRTFTYASPTKDDTFTIDGQSVTVTAGTSLSSFVSQINADGNLDVYAAQGTTSNSVVLYDRTTGQQAAGYINVADPAKTLVEQKTLAFAGQNAQYTINGGATQSSATDTVANAIAGVTLNLMGTTATGSPVTINVGAPAPSPTAVQNSVQQFVTDYNAAITAIEAQLGQAPVSNPVNQQQAGTGTLYQDADLTDLLSNMRQAMYAPGSGLPSGMASLADIGITTGAPSGDAAPSQSSINGLLTIDTTTLTNAINSNPSGVEQVLQAFSSNFQSIVGAVAGAGGTISTRISNDGDEISSLGNQLTDLQQTLTAQQTALQTEFANLSTAIQQSQEQSSWLTAQISGLSSSSTSGSSSTF